MVRTAGVPGLSVIAVGRHRSDGRERGRLGRVAGWNHAHYCLWHRANRERADGWPDGHGDERRHGRNLGGERNKYSPESKWESITRIEVLVGSGGVNEVAPPSLDDHLEPVPAG
jgi:hypothetical protein